MKTFILMFSIWVLSSCSGSVKTPQDISHDTVVSDVSATAISVRQDVDDSHDTLFYNTSFLILGSKNMKLDYLPSQSHNPGISSKGDTLFHNSEVTILGDNAYDTKVYVKYDPKFAFSQFLPDSVYTGRLASADVSHIKDDKHWKSVKRCTYLNIEEWKEYLITECQESGINFAGHYTIVEWGCGFQCQIMAIIDRMSGGIFFPDIPEDQVFIGE